MNNYQETVDRMRAYKPKKWEIPEWLEITIYIPLMLLGMALLAWSFFIAMDWIYYADQKSLFEVLKEHWQWFRHLRIL